MATPHLHASGARADCAWPTTPPPPQDVWIGKGQFGFLSSTATATPSPSMATLTCCAMTAPGKMKSMSAACTARTPASSRRSAGKPAAKPTTPSPAIYSHSAACAMNTIYSTDFNIRQASRGGMGYKIINTDDTKLTAQVGAGYRRLRPETIDKDADGEVISRTPLDAERRGESARSALISRTPSPKPPSSPINF